MEELLRHCLPYSLLSANAELIQRLAAAVEGRRFLVGEHLSLADVAIYATLLPSVTNYPVWHPLHAALFGDVDCILIIARLT